MARGVATEALGPISRCLSQGRLNSRIRVKDGTTWKKRACTYIQHTTYRISYTILSHQRNTPSCNHRAWGGMHPANMREIELWYDRIRFLEVGGRWRPRALACAEHAGISPTRIITTIKSITASAYLRSIWK